MSKLRHRHRAPRGKYPFAELCSIESLARLQVFVNAYEERSRANRRRMRVPAQRKTTAPVDITEEL